MAMNVNVKSEFAFLKWQQMLSEKYFVETCFSKKHDSYNSSQKLKDLWLKINCK